MEEMNKELEEMIRNFPHLLLTVRKMTVSCTEEEIHESALLKCDETYFSLSDAAVLQVSALQQKVLMIMSKILLIDPKDKNEELLEKSFQVYTNMIEMTKKLGCDFDDNFALNLSRHIAGSVSSMPAQVFVKTYNAMVDKGIMPAEEITQENVQDCAIMGFLESEGMLDQLLPHMMKELGLKQKFEVQIYNKPIDNSHFN